MSGTPKGIDVTVPNTARVYDYLLGGKDHFAADRELAEELLKIIPEARIAARHNHAFIGRAVEFLARSGIRQFVDVGTKLPTEGNVREVAARVAPESRVVFADYDPVTLVHARALLTATEHVAIVQADIRSEPESIMDHPDALALIDFDQPVAFILDRLLQFFHDTDEVIAVVGRLRERMAPGSYLVFTHITADPQPEAEDDVDKVFEPPSVHFVPRQRDEVLRIVQGFELVEPGLTYTAQWRPGSGDEMDDPSRTYSLAGVGLRR